MVFRCWSLGNSGGFCSLLATIQHLSNLILDSRLSILSFGFFRLHTSVNLNFNLIPLDSTLFGSGFLNGLWSVCFGSFPSVSVDKFGSGVAGWLRPGCSARLLVSLPDIPGSGKICGWRIIWFVGLANMDPSWSDMKRILRWHEEMAEANSFGLQQV